MSENTAKQRTNHKTDKDANVKQKDVKKTKDANNKEKKSVSFDLSSLNKAIQDIDINDNIKQNKQKTDKNAKKLIDNTKINELDKQTKSLNKKDVSNSSNNESIAVNNNNIESKSNVKTKPKSNLNALKEFDKQKKAKDKKLDDSILSKLFADLDKKYFNGYFADKNVIIKWTSRMFISAGLTLDAPVEIRISAKLHVLLPNQVLVETVLHEMIHAYIIFEKINEDHGPKFLEIMNRINKIGKLNITVFHNYTEEVEKYKEERRKKKLEKAEMLKKPANSSA